jgi:tetratricopeptide (TPR) repeat protein
MSRKRRTATSQRTSSPRPTPAQRTAAAQAAELEALALEYPEEREEILIDAAGEWSMAGEHERALALYQQLLETGCEAPHLVEAYRITELWEAGQVEQAREAATRLRQQHPKDAGAWNFVAETFEANGEPQEAADWFTAGIAHLLGAATPLTLASVDAAADRYGIEMLIIGRHRVRRLLGQPHDDADELADELHEHGPAMLRSPRSLDELHDPDRLRAAESGEFLQDEIEELTARGAAPSRPHMICALFWPKDEFTELLSRWPAMTDDYGADHTDHTHRVEESLRRLSEEGEPRLGVARGTVADFESYTRESGASPEEGDTRAAYAADLAARGQAQAWPPPRNNPCWCDSSRKYKKCCGNPALT